MRALPSGRIGRGQAAVATSPLCALSSSPLLHGFGALGASAAFFAGLSLRESLSSSACRAATFSSSLALTRSRSSASSSMLSPDRLRCGLMCCDLLWG